MINTLAALLAALTVGTMILMALETDPILPLVRNLIAASNTDVKCVRQTSKPFRKWDSIVVHATGSEGREITRMCHFIVPPAKEGGKLEIAATDVWREQQHTLHILGANEKMSATSISVCLDGDFTTRRPTDEQFRELMALVRTLQSDFKIDTGHVYLYRDVDASTFSPGRAFPEKTFTARLLRKQG